jgi:hypothetical protein
MKASEIIKYHIKLATHYHASALDKKNSPATKKFYEVGRAKHLDMAREVKRLSQAAKD